MMKQYPVLIHCVFRGSIYQAVAHSNCPWCLSNAVSTDWDVDLRLGRNELTLNKLVVAIPLTDDTVPVIAVTDIGIESLRK